MEPLHMAIASPWKPLSFWIGLFHTTTGQCCLFLDVSWVNPYWNVKTHADWRCVASEPPYGGARCCTRENTEPYILNLRTFSNNGPDTKTSVQLVSENNSAQGICRQVVDTDQSQIMQTVTHIISRWQLIFHSNETDNWVCGATEVEKSLVSFRWATLDALFIALHTYISFLNFQQAATLYTGTWVLKTSNSRWTFSEGTTANAKHHKHDIYNT